MDLQLARERSALLELLAKEGVRDARVIEAMGRVPREQFVVPGLEQHAYDNTPLPIGWGQTISQPLIVAIMVEALRIEPTHRILEIGTGFGYEAAVLAELAAEVFTVERLEPLATEAAERLRRARYDNVHVRCGDGSLGWPEHAPFDGIITAAAARTVPRQLLGQLRIGGRLVIPFEVVVGAQVLLCITRTEEHEFQRQSLGGVHFVPLVTGE